eukprot:GILK01006033.1.p1 GENE.GILK01006033.1~~GILK01006033.1.p1  ORF type:complete len:1199 (+),score=216.20 GILK01006033.1:264-3860(+)
MIYCVEGLFPFITALVASEAVRAIFARDIQSRVACTEIIRAVAALRAHSDLPKELVQPLNECLAQVDECRAAVLHKCRKSGRETSVGIVPYSDEVTHFLDVDVRSFLLPPSLTPMMAFPTAIPSQLAPTPTYHRSSSSNSNKSNNSVFLRRKESSNRLGKNPALLPNKPAGKVSTADVRNRFEHFLGEFAKCLRDMPNEMLETVQEIEKKIFNTNQATDDNLKAMVQSLESAFKKKKHKIYLLEMLREIVRNRLKIGSDAADQHLQDMMCSLGVSSMCLDQLAPEQSPEVVYHATKLALDLLRGGNRTVQTSMLQHLRDNGEGFFTLLRQQFRSSALVIYNLHKSSSSSGPLRTVPKNEGGTDITAHLLMSIRKVDKIQNEQLLTRNLLKLLQFFCDGCFKDFQDFLRDQHPEDTSRNAVSINVVNEVASYLINIAPAVFDHPEVAEVADQAFKTLIDFCAGPCRGNQELLANRHKLYQLIDLILSGGFNGAVKRPLQVSLLDSSIKYLLSLLEQNPPSFIPRQIIASLHIDKLYNKMSELYEASHSYQTNGALGSILPLLQPKSTARKKRSKRVHPEVSEQVELTPHGQQQQQTTENPAANKTVVGNRHFSLEFLKNLPKLGRPAAYAQLTSEVTETGDALEQFDDDEVRVDPAESALESGFSLFMLIAILKDAGDAAGVKTLSSPDSMAPNVVQAMQYFGKNTGTVEVNRDGTLELAYFRIPDHCRFLTEKSRKEVIQKANRTSVQEKLEHFFECSGFLEHEMRHQERLRRHLVVNWAASKWSMWANISLIMCLIMNLVMLICYFIEDDNVVLGDSLLPATEIITILGPIQIVSASIITVLYAIEYAPVSLRKAKTQKIQKKLLRFKLDSTEKLEGSALARMNFATEPTTNTGPVQYKRAKYVLWKVWVMMKDPYQFYYLLYLLFSLVGYIYSPFFYSLLLTDLIHRSDDLQNVLRAVTKNGKQLIMTSILGLCLIYVYSIFAFLWFKDDYQEEDSAPMYCDSLIYCFVSTIHYGLRAGGGIGDVIDQKKREDFPLFIGRFFFDLTFFMIVIIILLNIIFGIIIDTFGELRDERRAIEEDIKCRCFVCGIDKYEFDNRAKGFEHHVSCDHNVFSYLNFIIYIRNRPVTDCSGVEKYVKAKIDSRDVSWFPMGRALVLSAEDDEDSVEKSVKQLKQQLQVIAEQLEQVQVSTGKKIQ